MPAQHIPTVRYHPSETPRLIETSEDLAALEAAWQDHPYSDEELQAWHSKQEAAKDEAETPLDDTRPGQAPARSRR